MINKPTVSICMITHNHEKFICKAIEGVLMQECNFEVEFILANDYSSDQTNEVIQNIIKNDKKSSFIKYFNHESNIGMMQNFIFALDQCKGKYIALCDGDDYWIDKNKLQKQVDFMEMNPNFSACFHNAYVINSLDEKIYVYSSEKMDKNVLPKEIILHGGGIYPTASLLFKNKIQLPSFTLVTKAGDSALAFSLLGIGDFYYSKEIMCVYRKHEKGIYTSIHNNKEMKLEDIKSNIKLLIDFRSFYSFRFKKFFDDSVQNQLKRVSNVFGFREILKMLIKNKISLKDFSILVLSKINFII